MKSDSLAPNFFLQQSCRCQINVLSLNGYNYRIRCDATAKISQILEQILINEQLEENFFLGLCALIGGDFVFLPSKMKVLKVGNIYTFFSLNRSLLASQNQFL